MLYSTIIVALIIIFSLLTQLILISALKGGDKPVGIDIPLPKKKKKEVKMSEEERIARQILANVDNYNGTSQGQVKIERNKK